MGRHPKPQEVHERRGNPSRKNLNPDMPKVQPGVGDPPGWITGAARVIWLEQREWFENSKFLAITDREMFACYCHELAHLRSAALTGDGDEYRKWKAVWEKTAARLGASPTDRAKVLEAKDAGHGLSPFAIAKPRRGNPGKGGQGKKGSA